MVNYNERIERMLAQGTLTEDQAKAMQKTVSEIHSEHIEIPAERKRISLGLAAGVGSIILMVGLVAASSTGTVIEPEMAQNVAQTFNKISEVGEMNKSGQSTLMLLAIFGIPALLTVLGTIIIYNGLVTKEEEVYASWSQVESNLQRRADLIPNLASTIKGFIKHEKDVLEGVTKARSGGLGEILDAFDDLENDKGELTKLSEATKQKLGDEAFMQSLAAQQAKVGKNVNKLLGVVENYPELRSSDQFLELQAQLEGTENRINVSRMFFNDSVREFNASIRVIPGSIIASMGNFKRKAYFDAADEDEKSVEIKF